MSPPLSWFEGARNVASLLKKLLSVLLLAGLVGVVAYAMVKPDPTPEQTASPGGRRKGGPDSTAAPGEGPPRVPVLAVRATRQNVPVLLDAVGTVRPFNTVTIKPQVDGRILSIAFQEGQEVKAGDLLAEIDPATYQAALDQATARRTVTETQLANARRDYDRMAKIPNVMAQKTMDTQEAQVEQFEAQLKADDAAVASARTVLGYTRITTPIAGRTGFRLVDVGNLVRSGDAGIVTITEIDPIAVSFTLPQQRLREAQVAMARGPVAVEALASDGKPASDPGVLEVIDNQIDQQTGTIRMKARFANPDRKLWPGQFVNVRVKVDMLEGVIAVPTAAVQRGPAGTFVWMVGPDDAAVVRPIETALLTDQLAVVAKGLDGGEQIVTTGFARISEGARLVVRDAPVTVPSTYVAPPQPRGKGNRGGKAGAEAVPGGDKGDKKERRRRDPSSTDAPVAATPADKPSTTQ